MPVSALDFLEDFLADPPAAARQVHRKPPIAAGLAAYVLSGMGVALAYAVFERGLSFGLPWPAIIFSCLWQVITGALMTALFHLIADAAGGEGRASSLFVLLGFSSLGWSLLLPAALLCRAALPGAFWPLPLLMLSAGLVALWLRVRSVKDNYGIGLGMAWLVVILPYAAGVALGAVGLGLAMWAALAQYVKLFS
ncbi:MAG: YIP1 family protein [Elusimicrobia bacterium]|nr:YIP1 family protein [Elusimicrobiota bacterium]